MADNVIPPATPRLKDIEDALPRVREVLFPSPLTYSPILSEMAGVGIFLKWENRFKTGSFKERGVVNTLSRLATKEKLRGVCAASAGNHALALSYHAKHAGVPCTIVMPKTAPLVKVQLTREFGAEVYLVGDAFHESYAHAKELAQSRGQVFVSAFDDARVIAGQGTCGLEILDDLPEVDTVCVPIGGGGLASGIGIAVKAKKPSVELVGVRSEWAVAQRAGEGVKSELVNVSLADGIAVKTPGAITEPILATVIDHQRVASERAVAKAIIKLLESERAVVEGAGAAALTPVLERTLPPTAKNVVVIVSGSNIDMDVISRLISWDLGVRGRLTKLVVSVPDRPGSLSLTSKIVAEFGANVLEVSHDRSFSITPGNVDILFLVEVRDRAHKDELIAGLRSRSIAVSELTVHPR